jgi:Pyruvate/2-oxoacid:ferredoxin oxidoreductase gamma subunit
VPEPEQAGPEPHPQLRFEHVFATVGSQGVPQAAHWVALVAAHAAIPLVSQQS